MSALPRPADPATQIEAHETVDASGAPAPITPEALLALVRGAAGTFKRADILPTPEAASAPQEAPAFRPRPVAVVPEPALTPAEPEESKSQTAAAKPPSGFTPAPAPAAFDIEAERSAAWAEGHAAGLAERDAAVAAARAEALSEAREAAAREAEEARDLMAAAAARLDMGGAEMLDDLTARLADAVRRLASERAGGRIDETPRPFLRRMERMVREIAAGAASAKLMLNPADLVAIKPHIKGFSPLAKLALAPDPTLGRGDMRLRMDDITFSDAIAERENGSLA
ncbi:FliH/SctL family protein [Roseovarius aquimarinus]|uniref:FliH/SctL family protein n=1 Tax=Roseovarius aquimarinus TaxID=1229156 RepID=A0ABW7I5S4_9RHOB